MHTAVVPGRRAHRWPGWALGPVLLTALCTAAVALLVVFGLRLTFFNDDWYILLQRGGLSSVLKPFNGNIVILFVAVYRAMVALFGLHSQLPYRLFLGLWVAVLGVVVYLIVRSRLGTAIAVAAAAVTLFLGAAWEALLWFAGFGDFAPVALGLGALLALERDTPRRNVAACLLLVLSVLTFSIGIPFSLGAAVVVALRRRPLQAWIPALPVGLFAVWWIFYGSSQRSDFSLSNLMHLPRYVGDSLAASLGAIIGRQRAGYLALVLVCLVVVLIWWRQGRPRAWLMVYLATALCFWTLSGLNYSVGREPEASRYVAFDAPLMIVILAELFRGIRFVPTARAVFVGGAAASIALNAANLEAGFDFMQVHAAYAEADLGALRLVDGRAPPGLRLLTPIAGDPYLGGVTSGRYFEVTREHGTPAYFGPAQLAAAPVPERVAADGVLLAAGGLQLVPWLGRPKPHACQRVRINGAGHVAESLTGRGTMIENLSPAPLLLEAYRFAPAALAHPVSFLSPFDSTLMTMAPDDAQTPWGLVLVDPGPESQLVATCELRSEHVEDAPLSRLAPPPLPASIAPIPG